MWRAFEGERYPLQGEVGARTPHDKVRSVTVALVVSMSLSLSISAGSHKAYAGAQIASRGHIAQGGRERQWGR